MSIKARSLISLALVAALGACSTNEDSIQDVIDGDTVIKTLLNGVWKQCVNVAPLGPLSITYTFKADGTAVRSGKLHSNTDCSDAGTDFMGASANYSAYKIGGAVTIPAGSVGITEVSELDLTDADTGVTTYSILAIQGLTDLYLGDVNADPALGGSPDKRINTLESTPYKLQSP